MRLVSDTSWQRQGIALLWGSNALGNIARPYEVASIRTFLALARSWPDELPSGGGKMLVVAGLEGCLDTLQPIDAEGWLADVVFPAVIGFQEEYQGQAALVLWLPSGKKRLSMSPATEEYFWTCAPPNAGEKLALGRMLWAGAESEVGRILDPLERNQDFDGPAWIGLYHPRIS